MKDTKTGEKKGRWKVIVGVTKINKSVGGGEEVVGGAVQKSTVYFSFSFSFFKSCDNNFFLPFTRECDLLLSVSHDPLLDYTASLNLFCRSVKNKIK